MILASGRESSGMLDHFGVASALKHLDTPLFLENVEIDSTIAGFGVLGQNG